LFFSDTVRGSIYKTVSASEGVYSTTTFLSGFQRMLGVAHDPALPDTLYAVGRVNNTDVVIAMNTTIPQKYSLITSLPKIGNGEPCYLVSITQCALPVCLWSWGLVNHFLIIADAQFLFLCVQASVCTIGPVCSTPRVKATFCPEAARSVARICCSP
jgi:hypothetical protein